MRCTCVAPLRREQKKLHYKQGRVAAGLGTKVGSMRMGFGIQRSYTVAEPLLYRGVVKLYRGHLYQADSFFSFFNLLLAFSPRAFPKKKFPEKPGEKRIMCHILGRVLVKRVSMSIMISFIFSYFFQHFHHDNSMESVYVLAGVNYSLTYSS